MAMKPGKEIGNYRIVSEVGAGGMAVVYRAEHRFLGTVHAIKVLNASLARDEEMRSRFLEEGRIQARLRHPHITPVTDFIALPEVTGLVMPLLEGESLWQRMRRLGSIPLDDAVAWSRQTLDALSFVHAQGIVHRDIKPSNLFLETVPREGPRVRVMDFGIAKVMQNDLTRITAPIGTLKYMSPEHIRSMKEVDHRSDLYSLGVVMYELLSGVRAFDGDSAFALQERIVRGEYTPLRSLSGAIPPHLADVVDRAMATNREDRFDSAASFARALQPTTAEPSQTERVPEPIDGRPPVPASPSPLVKVRAWMAAWEKRSREHLVRVMGRASGERPGGMPRGAERPAAAARKAYAEQLHVFLKSDMLLDAPQARVLQVLAEQLGLSTAEVIEIEQRVGEEVTREARALARADAQDRAGQARLERSRQRREVREKRKIARQKRKEEKKRAQKTLKRRRELGLMSKNLTSRFGEHVVRDLLQVWKDVFRVSWQGYGLKLKYGIRQETGGLIHRLYCLPSLIALPVARLFGILRWDTLGWQWRVAMKESRTKGIWPVMTASMRTPPLVLGCALVMTIRMVIALLASAIALVLLGPWFLDFYLRNRH